VKDGIQKLNQRRIYIMTIQWVEPGRMGMGRTFKPVISITQGAKAKVPRIGFNAAFRKASGVGVYVKVGGDVDAQRLYFRFYAEAGNGRYKMTIPKNVESGSISGGKIAEEFSDFMHTGSFTPVGDKKDKNLYYIQFVEVIDRQTDQEPGKETPMESEDIDKEFEE